MAGTLPNGKALDDVEPQDAVRLVSEVFDKVADVLLRGGPLEEERYPLEEEMRRAAKLMRAWAKFGRWEPLQLERAKKFAARITDKHFRAVQCASADPGDSELLLEATDSLDRLLRVLR